MLKCVCLCTCPNWISYVAVWLTMLTGNSTFRNLWFSCQSTYSQPQTYLTNTVVSCASVLWRCWLGGRKGIWPVEDWVVGCWHGYLSGARCRLAHGPADALPLTVSCFSKIQIGFTFLVLTHLGSPGKRAVKWVCVCVWFLVVLVQPGSPRQRVVKWQLCVC